MYTYRNIKEEMRQLQGIIDDDSSHLFNGCPACPKVQLTVHNTVGDRSDMFNQEQGILTLSVDANFGLCRKKAAGTSVHDPLSKTAMFLDQNEVNDNYSGAKSEAPSVSINV